MSHVRSLLTTFALAACVTLAPSIAHAENDANWPGWRGPNRDGKSDDTGLLKSWPDDGPRLLWKVEGLGGGFSSMAVVDDMVYTTGVVNGELILYAFDMTGAQKWTVKHGSGFTGNRPGARGTPVISDGKLYVVSGTGRIGCFDAKTGKEVWARHMKDFGGSAGNWGFAESVLIADGMAIVTPGGQQAIVALDAKTGETKWTSRGNGGAAHYCSAIAVDFEGIPMVIQGNRAGLFAVRRDNGDVLWTSEFSANNTANIPTPAYSDGYVFWANGYGKGGVCLKMTKTDDGVSVDTAYRTRDMVCHHGGYVIVDGYVYGNHNNGYTCLDLKTGKKQWEGRGVGKGAVMYADGMLFMFGENGQAGLAEATPQEFKMTGTIKLNVRSRYPAWSHPVVTGGRLYLRFEDQLFCYDVSK